MFYEVQKLHSVQFDYKSGLKTSAHHAYFLQNQDIRIQI
jgi:hypothetical protein